jgi:hypothetical protein
MDWFEKLTGFEEGNYEETQSRLAVSGDRLTSKVNGKSYGIGRLELVSLDELRGKLAGASPGRLRVRNISADVTTLHQDPRNRGALFQVASQFNLLEMVGPSVTPEQGVTCYAGDPTQGPACAISAGAATIYRNYFAPVAGQVGQTAQKQIDTVAELQRLIADAIGVTPDVLWNMRNGYALPTREGLRLAVAYINAADETAREWLKGRLRIGLHRDVEVTVGGSSEQIVSQAFCSAMPVSYSGLNGDAWAPLARIILEASYEATLAAAVVAANRSEIPVVFLTRLGGGAFGNADEWIVSAIRLALDRFRDIALNVIIVSHGSVPPSLMALEAEFAGVG